MHTNILQQLKVDRALEQLEKKLKEGQASLNLIAFLEKKTAKKEQQTDLVLESIKTKSLKVVDQSNLAVVTKLQIQQEVLEAEKKVLERFFAKARITSSAKVYCKL